MNKREHAKPPGWGIRASFVAGALALLVLAAQLPVSMPCQAPATAQAGGSFEGDWSATGTRQVLAAGPGHKAVIAYFSGTLLLKAEGGLDRGYRAEVIAYDNGLDVSVGTCVWTNEKGEEIYSDLKGQAVGTGKHIHGTITGGTGRYAGITGEFEFDWQYVITTPEGDVQGRVSSLKGTWRKGPATDAPAPGKAAP